MSDEKAKKNGGNILPAVLLTAACAGTGFLMGYSGILSVPEDAGISEFIGIYLLQILLLFLSFYLQLIIHECGHLIAGRMTGYRFLSFRIGSLMLLKTHEGFSFKRYSLAGTGGQCLLIPPEKNPDGTYPYKLYHLGGVLFNLITAAVFAVLFIICPRNSVSAVLLYLAASGVLCALMNGIPMRTGGVANDGYNVIHIGKEPFALDAMWLQLKINEAQTEGARLKDLPKEWFEIPDDAAKDNEIISTITVFSENRAMDALDFPNAKEIIEKLSDENKYTVIGLYKNLLQLDNISVDLIEKGDETDVSVLDSRESKAFLKAMARFPSVIRTEYAVALLKNKDVKEAEDCIRRFESVAAKYPVQSDIDSEKEIMDYIASLK